MVTQLMQTIAILSDTHIPSRAAKLPDWVETEISDADIVLHAGDFDSIDACERVRALSTELIAVEGNADPDLGLPEMVEVTVEECSFVLTHGSGSLNDYPGRIRSLLEGYTEPVVLIAGHSHELTDERIGPHRFINPGSATGISPAERASMVIASVDAGRLDTDVKTN